jgi:hypothetical protein
LHHVLRGRQIVDPTFFQHDGRWSAVYRLPGQGRQPDVTRLSRRHSRRTVDCTRAQPAEVGSGVGPAGGPAVHAGRMSLSTAQDCRRTYGGAVTLMKVETLSPTRSGRRRRCVSIRTHAARIPTAVISSSSTALACTSTGRNSGSIIGCGGRRERAVLVLRSWYSVRPWSIVPGP